MADIRGKWRPAREAGGCMGCSSRQAVFEWEMGSFVARLCRSCLNRLGRSAIRRDAPALCLSAPQPHSCPLCEDSTPMRGTTITRRPDPAANRGDCACGGTYRVNAEVISYKTPPAGGPKQPVYRWDGLTYRCDRCGAITGAQP